jgi:hypothetical protein
MKAVFLLIVAVFTSISISPSRPSADAINRPAVLKTTKSQQLGTISGLIRLSDGWTGYPPEPDRILVKVYSSSTGELVQENHYDKYYDYNNGILQYTTDSLPYGQYKVRFEGIYAPNSNIEGMWGPIYYNQKTTFASANVITLNQSNIGNISAILPFSNTQEPQLSLNVQGPENFGIANGQYTPSTFSIIANATNTSIFDAIDVQAHIELESPGLLLIEGEQSHDLGLLTSGAISQALWKVSINPFSSGDTVEYTITLSSSNAEMVVTHRTVVLPPLDSDMDGLLNSWENIGIDADHNGVIDLNLKAAPYNARSDHKDIFVEIDYMTCSQGGCLPGDSHDHRPLDSTIDNLVKAFDASPVQNPDRDDGITLHIFRDEAIKEVDTIRFESRGSGISDDFDDFKLGSNNASNPGERCGFRDIDGHFGTLADRSNSTTCENVLAAKRLVFRYAIFGHKFVERSGSTGVAELPGNDFMVTLGGWDYDAFGGRSSMEAGTFMHEMGHTLNLRHGGSDNINCKPNYLSIMSYSLQFTKFDSTRPLDYSPRALRTLTETNLMENDGVGGPSERLALYGINGKGTAAFADRPIDWNGNNSFSDTNITADINYISDIPDCPSSPKQVFLGHDDWANLLYGVTGTGDNYADGFRDTKQVREPTEEEVRGIAQADYDSDGVENFQDNCVGIPNENQTDTDSNGTGDKCEVDAISALTYLPIVNR